MQATSLPNNIIIIFIFFFFFYKLPNKITQIYPNQNQKSNQSKNKFTRKTTASQTWHILTTPNIAPLPTTQASPSYSNPLLAPSILSHLMSRDGGWGWARRWFCSWVGVVVLYKERKKTKGKRKDEGEEKIEEKGEENGSIMKWKKKRIKNGLQMNSNYAYMHNYYSKMIYLHISTPTNVGTFWPKMCIYNHFFEF